MTHPPVLTRFFLVLLIILFNLQHSQAQNTSKHHKLKVKQSAGYTYKEVTNDPLNTRIYTLDNGLTVYLSDYELKPRIQTYIAVGSGSKHDPSDNSGLAHYLEHILFKGTSRIGTSNWQKEQKYLNRIEALYEKRKQTDDPDLKKAIYHKIDSLSRLASRYAIPNEYDKLMASIGAKGTNAYTFMEETVYINNIPSNQIKKWATIEAERFSEITPRLFHTELETVYEEKNRSLDDDGHQVWHALLDGLFERHPYAPPTTIGKTKHLKNPSIKAIKAFFNKHYVPNNMAVCISGDIDYDSTIKIIDRYFGKLKAKQPPKFHAPKEKPIKESKVKEVTGPEDPKVNVAFRFRGRKDRESLLLDVTTKLLKNGQAGIMDINLNKQQRVLNANVYDLRLNDYSMQVFSAKPLEGQSLEEAKELLLNQVDSLKQGKFSEELLQAVINDYRIQRMRKFEKNRHRAHAFADAFLSNMKWQDYLNELNEIQTLKKKDIVDFARNRYKDNYVVVYKRQGKDTSHPKVSKPPIGTMEVNRNQQSAFFKKLKQMEAPPIEPEFLDFKEDLTHAQYSDEIPLRYKHNKENELFKLHYVFDMGSNHDKKLPIAIKYLKYLGTKDKSSREIESQFFTLGCDYNVSTSKDRVYVTLKGLNENFDEALKLFENLIRNAQPDSVALQKMVNSILKSRKNRKHSKNTIHRKGMVNYAKYGPESPFTHILSEEELKGLKPDELISRLHKLPDYKHRILYYGPRTVDSLKTGLKTHHRVRDKLKPVPEPKEFPTETFSEGKVYWTSYDMVQAEVIFLSKSKKFKKSLVPEARLFNEYFGNNMSSVAFQEIRESRGLAYAVSSRYSLADEKDKHNYVVSYLGTQADKLPEALQAMDTLHQRLPHSEDLFNNAKTAVVQDLRSSRVVREGILWAYERALERGLEEDIRKYVFSKIPDMTFRDIEEFHKSYIHGSPFRLLIIGKKENLNFDALENYGQIIKLETEEIFGY